MESNDMEKKSAGHKIVHVENGKNCDYALTEINKIETQDTGGNEEIVDKMVVTEFSDKKAVEHDTGNHVGNIVDDNVDMEEQNIERSKHMLDDNYAENEISDDEPIACLETRDVDDIDEEIVWGKNIKRNRLFVNRDKDISSDIGDPLECIDNNIDDESIDSETMCEQNFKGNKEIVKDVDEEDEMCNEIGDTMESIDDDEDIEAIRARNIERNKRMMAELMKDAPDFMKTQDEHKPQRKRNSKPKPTIPVPIERRSSGRNRGERVRYDEYELDKILGDDDKIKHSRKRTYDEMHNGKENSLFRWKINMKTYKRTTVPELAVSEVTAELIANISNRAFEKVYSKIGTSCHQCRQKTLDTKTYCRSGKCTGVRGQFCGPCLDGRYGENVVDALQNPNWCCPPCRGICNCSICLSRQGFAPTGILRPYCIEKGYKSVKHYLEAIEKDIDNDPPKEEIDSITKKNKFPFDVDDFPEEVPDVFEGFE